MNTHTNPKMDSPWMQTMSGVQWDLLDPKIADVVPTDISHALSMLCRYNGHVKRFYSVAEHSCHAHDMAVKAHPFDNALAFYALMHDAHEAYIGDVTTPLAMALATIAAPSAHPAPHHVLKQRHDKVIFAAVNLDETLAQHVDARWVKARVKAFDLGLLMAEREELLAPPPAPWGSFEGISPAKVKIEGWSPERAKAEFENRLAIRYGYFLSEVVGIRDAVVRGVMASEMIHGPSMDLANV